MRHEDRVDRYRKAGMDDYAARVRAYEDAGMSTSDAQGVVDAEDARTSEREERKLDDPRRGQAKIINRRIS